MEVGAQHLGRNRGSDRGTFAAIGHEDGHHDLRILVRCKSGKPGMRRQIAFCVPIGLTILIPVAREFGRASLAGNRNPRDARISGRALRPIHCAEHALANRVQMGRVHGYLAADLSAEGPHHLAFGIGDVIYQLRAIEIAAVGDHGRRVGHLERRR